MAIHVVKEGEEIKIPGKITMPRTTRSMISEGMRYHTLCSKTFYVAADRNNVLTCEHTVLRAAHVKGHKNSHYLFKYSCTFIESVRDFACSLHKNLAPRRKCLTELSLALRLRNNVTVGLS